MKSHIRLPTTQYGYIEFEFEGTAEDAIHEHNRLLKLYSGGEGLPEKEWRDFLTEWFSTGTVVNGSEAHEKMSPQQQWCVNEYKKTLKRIKYNTV